MKFPTTQALLTLAIMLGSAGISTFDSAFALSKTETSSIKSNKTLISQRNNDDRNDNKDNRPTRNDDRNNRTNAPDRTPVNVIRPNVNVNVNRPNDWNRSPVNVVRPNVNVNVNRPNDWNRPNVPNIYVNPSNVNRSNDWDRRNVNRPNDWNRPNVPNIYVNPSNVNRSNDWDRRNVNRSNDWNRRNVVIRPNNWSRPTIINNNNYVSVFNNRDRGWYGGGWNGRGYYTPPGWNIADFVSGLIIGAILTSPPPYYSNVYVSGNTYLYSDGVFLRPINNRYTVVAPPIGAVVYSLADGCTPDPTNFNDATQYNCSGVLYEPFYDGDYQAYRVIGY
ncbi:hypothetical protein Syn7502_01743 [Synechococcus sp. PCC 7502]|uniref:DUF6515 family protein n=1 Tax=Synechococcus sp. PCC 7502 TaxID=1173263 RepID=UPI00029FAE47|nr:DUF6515 family protein [Synechococcus sp. PCC 7502]AFY73790.1 hypothetical protein Syn7502_01743 [Synechococcus sp. PCC 7502]